MTSESKARDVMFMQQLFSPTDAEAMLKTPLLHVVMMDKHIWKLSKDGNYSVKFNSRLCMESLSESTRWKLEGDRRMLWDLQVPPKVRAFAW